ncbi:MAG: hypothetical protein ACYC5J_11720 [Chloroflexota bacterium]
MSVLRSFWRGWARATALWPVVLLLYLVDTVLATVVSIPSANQLSQIFGRSAMAPDLMGPYSLDWLVETPGSWDATFFPWPLYLLVPLLFLLVATFLRGGTIGTMVWDAPPFRWTGFFSDCARFFGRFLLLLLFFVPGLILVGLVFLGINLALGQLPSSAVVAALRAALLPFLLFLLLLAADYARISLVSEPERSIWRHVARGGWFLVRRFPHVVLLGLGFALAAALFGALYPALLQFTPIGGTTLLAPLVQQITILLLTWQRVASLGGEVALYRGG